MNWKNIDFDWNHARAFLVTAEEGTLSAAARVLGASQPTLSRQVAALENDLNIQLFERVGKSLILTDPGRALLAKIRPMGEAAGQVSLVASGQTQSISGVVRITAVDLMAAWVLPYAVGKIQQLAPDLRIDIIAENEVQDISRREADIAIRHVRPTQPGLFARLIREANARFFASRAYLARHGTPQTEADLINHRFVGFDNPAQMIDVLKAETGITVQENQIAMCCETPIVAWEFVRRGHGIALMSEELARLHPDVVPLLEDRPALKYPVWLVTHSELHSSRRIRLVFDVLAEVLSDRWDQKAGLPSGQLHP